MGGFTSLASFVGLGHAAKKGAEKLFPIPEIPEIPKAPTTGDKAVQEAAAEAARRRQRARGFRSTILSREFLEPGAPALKSTLGS